MSSRALPAITLELRTDWRVIGLLAAWPGLLLICLWQADLPAPLLLGVSAVIAGVTALAVDSQLFGISPRAPLRATRASSGEWHLVYPDGNQALSVLGRSSRPIAGGALLTLIHGRRSHWLFLAAPPTNGRELRRLRVLLRLQQ